MDVQPSLNLTADFTPCIHEILASLHRCTRELSGEALSESQQALALSSLYEYLCRIYPYACRSHHSDKPEQQQHTLSLCWRKGFMLDLTKLSSTESFENPCTNTAVSCSFEEEKKDAARHKCSSSAPLSHDINVEFLHSLRSGVLRSPEGVSLNPVEINFITRFQTEGGMLEGAKKVLLNILEGYECFLGDVIVSMSRDNIPPRNFIFSDDSEEVEVGRTESVHTSDFGPAVFVCNTISTPTCEEPEIPMSCSNNNVPPLEWDVSREEHCQRNSSPRVKGRDLWWPGRHSPTAQALCSDAPFHTNWHGVLQTGRLLFEFVHCALFGGAVSLDVRSSEDQYEGRGAPSEGTTPYSLVFFPKRGKVDVAVPSPALAELRRVVYANVRAKILVAMQTPSPLLTTELKEPVLCHATLPWWLWSFAVMGLHEIGIVGEGAAPEGQCSSSTPLEPLAFLLKCTNHLMQQCSTVWFQARSSFGDQKFLPSLGSDKCHDSRICLFSLSSNKLLQGCSPVQDLDVVATQVSTPRADIDADTEEKCRPSPVAMHASFESAPVVGGGGSDSGEVVDKPFVSNRLSENPGGNVLMNNRKSFPFPNVTGGCMHTQGATSSCACLVQCTLGDTTDASSIQANVAESRAGKGPVTRTFATPDEASDSSNQTLGLRKLYGTAAENNTCQKAHICGHNLFLQQKNISESTSLLDKANSESVVGRDCEGESPYNLALVEDAVASGDMTLRPVAKLEPPHASGKMDALPTLLPNTSASKQQQQQFSAHSARGQSKSPPSHMPLNSLSYPATGEHLSAMAYAFPSTSLSSPLHGSTDINAQCKRGDPGLSLSTGALQPERISQALYDRQLRHLDDFIYTFCSTLRPASMLALDGGVSSEMALRISLKLLNHIFESHPSQNPMPSLLLEPQQPQKKLASRPLLPSFCSYCFLARCEVIVESLTDTGARVAAQALTYHRLDISQELIGTLSLLEVWRSSTTRFSCLDVHGEGLTADKEGKNDGSSSNLNDNRFVVHNGLQQQRPARPRIQPHATFLCVWLVNFRDVSDTVKHLLKSGYSSPRPFETLNWHLAGLADYLIQVEQHTWKLLKGSINITNDDTFTPPPLVPLRPMEEALFERVIPPAELLSSIVEFIGTLVSLFTCNSTGDILWVEEGLNDPPGDAGATRSSDSDETHSFQSSIYELKPQCTARSSNKFRSWSLRWVKLSMHYFLEIIDVSLRCSMHLPEKPLFLYILAAGLSSRASAQANRSSDCLFAQQQCDVTAAKLHSNDPYAVTWHHVLSDENSCLSQIHHFLNNYSCAVVKKLLNKTFSRHTGMRSVLCQDEFDPDNVTGDAAVYKTTIFSKGAQLESMMGDKHDTMLSPPRYYSNPVKIFKTTPYNNPYKRKSHTISTMRWPTEPLQLHCRARRILEHAQLVANFLTVRPLKATQHILDIRENSSDGCLHPIGQACEIGPVLFPGVASLLDIVSGPCTQLLSAPCGEPSANTLSSEYSIISSCPFSATKEPSDCKQYLNYDCLSRLSLGGHFSDTCDGLWLITCLLELLSSVATPINCMPGSNPSEALVAKEFATSIKDVDAQDNYQNPVFLLHNAFSVFPSSHLSTYVRLLFFRIVHVFYFNLQHKVGKENDNEHICTGNSPHTPHQNSFYQPLFEHWQRYCRSLLHALRIICWHYEEAHETAHMLHISSVLAPFLRILMTEDPTDVSRVLPGAEEPSPSYSRTSLVAQVGNSGADPRSGNFADKKSASNGPTSFNDHKNKCGPKVQAKAGRLMMQGEHRLKINTGGVMSGGTHSKLAPLSCAPTGARSLKRKDLGLPSSSLAKGASHTADVSISLPDNTPSFANDNVLISKLHLSDIEFSSYDTPSSSTRAFVERVVPEILLHSSCRESKTPCLGGDERLGVMTSPLTKNTPTHGAMNSNLRAPRRDPSHAVCRARQQSLDCPRPHTKEHLTHGKRRSSGEDCVTAVDRDDAASRRPVVPPLFGITTHTDPVPAPSSGGISLSNKKESPSSKRSAARHASGDTARTRQPHPHSPSGFMSPTISAATGITLLRCPSIVMELILCIAGLVLHRKSGFIRYDFTVSSLTQNRVPLRRATTPPAPFCCPSSAARTANPTQGSSGAPRGLPSFHVLSDLQSYLQRPSHEPVVCALRSWLAKQYGEAQAQLAKAQLFPTAPSRLVSSALGSHGVGKASSAGDSCCQTPPHQTDTLLEPLASGHYVLLRLLLPRKGWLSNFLMTHRIGAGGFGTVFRATLSWPPPASLGVAEAASFDVWDCQEAAVLARYGAGPLAVKLLPMTSQGGRGGCQALCHAEVLALHRLRGHPHILPLLSFGTTGGEFFVITPECTGGSVWAWRLARAPTGLGALRGDDSPPAGPSLFSQCAAVFTQVLTAVACAHQHHIRHGDLKAGNVFIDTEPRRISIEAEEGKGRDFPMVVRLGDFGSCDCCDEEDMRLLFDDVALGEAHFMAARWGSAKGTEAIQPPEIMVPRRRYQIFRGLLNDYLTQNVPNLVSGSGGDRFYCPLSFTTSGGSTTSNGEHVEGANSPRSPPIHGKLKALFERMQRVELSVDIWGCGCLLYELLTGYMLFGGSRLGNLAVLANIASHTPPTNNFNSHGGAAASHDMPSSHRSPTNDCETSKRLAYNAMCSCAVQVSPLGTALNEQEQDELAKSVGEIVLEYLCQLLSLDPLERPTAREALHRWVEITHKSCPSFE